MKLFLAASLLIAACSFNATQVDVTADASDPGVPGEPVTGTTPAAGDDVVNIGKLDEIVGTDDLTVGAPGASAAVTDIDTTKLTISGLPTLPTGVQFKVVARDGVGLDLAVLHVHTLNLQGIIHVAGVRPLVVIADAIELSAKLSITAHNPAMVPGDKNVLTANRGGAIELYARQHIAISGEITAGTAATGAGAGTPGGPGAIVLQSPEINNQGRLASQVDSVAASGKGTIVMLYKTTVMVGTADPLPVPAKY